ncbi:MAG TPA: tyrosine-type recombinase/integrase [Saprospiraceae bacterium]|nr:tyrosine-type recombinase/integrase [Saprospiraceae bacterium]
MVQKDLLTGFGDYLQYERRYSAHTLESYLRDTTQFSEYLLLQYGYNSYRDVTHHQVRSWVVALLHQKIGTVSVRRKLSALAHFFKWLRRKGLVDHNPMVKVHLPKVPDRLPKSIAEKSLQQLWNLSEADEDVKNFSMIRDKALLSLLYGGGLRRSEVIQLKWTAIDFSRRTMRIDGKGRKIRNVPMNETLIIVLKSLKKVTLEKWGEGIELVLLTDSGKPCYPKFVYNRVVRMLSSVTTSEKKSPHVLRHSMATHLMDHGAELNAVKEILGHASLSSTQVYTHNSIARIKEVYRQAHPGAQKSS